jgi:predicted AAA+ superfamily ATPase
MYKRDLSKIVEKELKEKEVLIIYGARQVGKTTLIKAILKNKKGILLNCENPTIASILESKDLARIKQLIAQNNFVAFDEAQKVPEIGEVLKLLYDEDSIKCKLIASGSSSFELAGRITESLTGRNRKLILYPLSLNEINEKDGWLWLEENIERIMLYGQYPAVLNASEERKEIVLNELASDYLYKDILAHEQLKNSSLLHKLLKALALQTGSQVSVNELSGLLGIANHTVEKYLDLLEKNFVIYQLGTYSTNLRNELKKSRKYYFYDLGIRNAILNNFSSLDVRQDVGQLWENFCVNERMKHNGAIQKRVNYYFWRTYDRAEIDLIEESEGKLKTFEFKWRLKRRVKIPDSFEKKYGETSLNIISKDNFFELFH